MRLKTVLFIFCVFLVLAFTATCVFAADAITERTGTIVVVTPDGTVTTVGPNDPLPPMPSGTAITVISGTIKMSPTAGSYTVTIGDTTVTVGAGDSVECGFNDIGEVEVESISGTIETVTNGVITIVEPGEKLIMPPPSPPSPPGPQIDGEEEVDSKDLLDIKEEEISPSE